MGFWTEKVIGVPRLTFKKLEDLVDEVYFLEADEEIDRSSRSEMAEKLAVRVLTDYVHEYFEESTKAAAQMFRNRRRERDRYL